MATRNFFDSSTDTTNNGAPDAHQLLTSMAQFTRRELQPMLDGLFTDCLNAQTTQQFGDNTQTIVDKVSQARTQIEQKFYQGLEECFHTLDTLIDSDPADSVLLNAPPFIDDEPDLSECIDAIVVKANHHYQGVLTQIQDRVHQIFVTLPANVDELPISPVRLLSLYQSSVASVPFDKNTRRLLYRLFEDKVLGRCNRLYSGLIELLSQATPAGSSSAQSTGSPKSSTCAPSLPTTDLAPAPSTPVTRDPFASPFGSASNGFASPFSSSSELASPFSQSDPFRSQPFGTGSGGFGAQSPDAAQHDVAQQLHQERRKFQKTSIDRQSGEDVVNHIQGEESHAQARETQAYSQLTDGVEEHVVETREVIRQERIVRRQQSKGITIEQIRRDTPLPAPADSDTYENDLTPEPRQIAHSNNDTENNVTEVTEIVSMVFEFILDDSHIAPELRALIGKLQLPMVRLATVDRTLFTRRKHPARKLLNELAQFCTQWSDAEHEHELISEIKLLVEEVLDNFSGSTDVFDSARDRLREFIDLQGNTLDLADSNEIKERKANSATNDLQEDVINQEIDTLLQQYVLPACVRELIVESWSQVLTLHLAKEGEQGAQYRRATENMYQLAEWMRFNSDEVNTGPTAQQFDSLLEEMSEDLNAIGFTAITIEKQFTLLEQEYERRFGVPDITLQPETIDVLETLPEESINSLEKTTHLSSQELSDPILDGPAEVAEVEDPVECTATIDLDTQDSERSDENGHYSEQLQVAAETEESQTNKQNKEWVPSFNADEIEEEEVVEVEISDVGFCKDSVEIESEHKRDKFDKMADHLKIGELIELTDGYGYKFRAKLAEVDEAEQKLHFIDKAGHRIASRTVKGLASELRRGDAQLGVKESLLSSVFGSRKQ